MSQAAQKRRMFFANRMHREMFFLVFWSMLIPAALTAIGLFYLIFSITAEQAGFPETIAYTLIPAAKKVLWILAVTTPAVMAVALFLAHRLTHRIVGPFDRIVREMDQILKGERQGPIVLRPQDKFQPLVDLINRLIAKK
jgi:hypothetical protein